MNTLLYRILNESQDFHELKSGKKVFLLGTVIVSIHDAEAKAGEE